MSRPFSQIHRQRIAIVIVCFLGVAASYLNWFQSDTPHGNLTGREMSGILPQVLFIICTLVALSGQLNTPLTSRPYWVVIGLGLLSVLLATINVIDGVQLIAEHALVHDIAIGPGLWLNLAAGVALVVVTWVFKQKGSAS